MRRFFVSADGFGGTVRLDQYKSGRVFDELDHIKSRNAGLFQTRGRIGHGGLFEGLNAFEFYLNMDVDDEHDEKADASFEDLRFEEN